MTDNQLSLSSSLLHIHTFTKAESYIQRKGGTIPDSAIAPLVALNCRLLQVTTLGSKTCKVFKSQKLKAHKATQAEPRSKKPCPLD